MNANEQRLFDAAKARQVNVYKGYPQSDHELLNEAVSAMQDVPEAKAKEILENAEAEAMDETWR